MHYRLEYTEKARQDIDSLDHSVRQRIISKLDYFLTLPNPLVVAKRLSGVIDATFRFRVGDSVFCLTLILKEWLPYL